MCPIAGAPITVRCAGQQLTRQPAYPVVNDRPHRGCRLAFEPKRIVFHPKPLESHRLRICATWYGAKKLIDRRRAQRETFAVVIRQALERATIERAARSASPEDIARIDDILARQRFFSERTDLTAFHDSDEAFHEAIAGISGHPGIWRYLKPVKLQIDRARRLTLPKPGRMEFVLSEHHVIRDAIATHDPAAAIAAMERHLNAVIPDIEELRRAFPDYFE